MIRFEAQGSKYLIVFTHDHVPGGKECPYCRQVVGKHFCPICGSETVETVAWESTTARLFRDEDFGKGKESSPLVEATVRRHHKDKPNRNLARKYALTKLLAYSLSNREVRKAAWKAFWSRSKKFASNLHNMERK